MGHMSHFMAKRKIPRLFETRARTCEGKETFGRVVSALNFRERENIAIVGGGGKTSLMFSLAEALSSKGKRVVTSTTTKIRQGEAGRSPRTILFPGGDMVLEEIKESLELRRHVFVGQSIIPPGKVKGISRKQADRLFESGWMDYVIIEADGANGLPLKAHAEHEPVIPQSATMVIAVAGLDALGKILGGGVVFREELFMKLTGMKPGQRITRDIMAGVFSGPDGLFKSTPSHSRRAVFLNKEDTLEDVGAAEAVALSILDKAHDAPGIVVTGSLQKGEFAVYRKDI